MLKDKIMQIVDSGEGTCRINNISALKRWTKDGLNDVDMLVIEFVDIVNGFDKIGKWYPIRSRDYEGIINECAALTELYMTDVITRLVRNMKAGHAQEE